MRVFKGWWSISATNHFSKRKREPHGFIIAVEACDSRSFWTFRGGSALDAGCGCGRAAITLAKAFPKARVFGYDNHSLSIGRAIANADAEGADVRFHVADCVNLPANEFDFISTFDVVH